MILKLKAVELSVLAIIVFLRLRENKRKNHCLTDATLSYECEPSACKMKIFGYRPKPM
jgi:hypothetical protein